jgi:hypothetical protein
MKAGELTAQSARGQKSAADVETTASQGLRRDKNAEVRGQRSENEEARMVRAGLR